MAKAKSLRYDARSGNDGRYVLFTGDISSFFLFGYCLCLAVTIVLADGLYIKLVQFIFFCGLVWLTKKKRYLLGTIVVFSFIVLFNLTTVEGKALFTVFGHPVTDGALGTGIARGLTIVTLFYMSKSLIGPTLSFHGRTGSFLGKVFLYFDFFTNEIRTVRVKTLWKDIDRLLLIAATLGKAASRRSRPGKIRIRSVFLLGGILFANIILLILNYAFFNFSGR